MIDPRKTIMELTVRILTALLLCVVVPYFAITLIMEHLPLNWWNIFMVSGMESLWVYLCWDLSRWIKQAWDDR